MQYVVLMTADVYELVKFFPINVREFFKRQLDFAADEVHNYNIYNNVTLNDHEKQVVLITVFLNLVENGFIKSYKSYQNAVSYINKFGIRGFSVGSKEFEKSSSFTENWEEFLHDFNVIKWSLQRQKLFIPGRSVPDLIQFLIKHRYE